MTDTSVLVRKATIADVPALSQVGSGAFVQAYAGTADPEDIVQHVENYFGVSAIASEIACDNVSYYMASVGDRCAGLVKVRTGAVPVALPSDNVMEVQQLYVATDIQRGGIGGSLMDQATIFGRENSADGIWLSVWEDAVWATKFYMKYGFEPMGELSFRLGTTAYRDLLMYLPLAK